MSATLTESKLATISEGFLPIPAEIVKIELITAIEKVFTLKLPSHIEFKHKPCQFLMVSVFGFGEAPISICSGPDDADLEICVRKIGSLTSKLHQLKLGDIIGIRGPYGNGFPVDVLKDKDLLFVAGGLGLAPLRSLIHYVFAHRQQFKQFTLLYGSKKPKDRLFTQELEQWQKSSQVYFLESVDVSDTLWDGHVGLITSLFSLISPNPDSTVGVMVGPPVMYKFVMKEMLSKKLDPNKIYLDLERRMRCGLGKCGHCQMNEIYVCQKGPVFNYADLASVKEAI